MISCLIRLNGPTARRSLGGDAVWPMWVVRSSDLVRVPLSVKYWKIDPAWGEQSHPVYGVAGFDIQYASVWQYQPTAENFIARNGLHAELFWSPVKPTGNITSDGRRHLVPVA